MLHKEFNNGLRAYPIHNQFESNWQLVVQRSRSDFS